MIQVKWIEADFCWQCKHSAGRVDFLWQRSGVNVTVFTLKHHGREHRHLAFLALPYLLLLLVDTERYLKVIVLFLYSGRESEQSVRGESLGFRYRKTPVKTSYSQQQVQYCLSCSMFWWVYFYYYCYYYSEKIRIWAIWIAKLNIWFIQHTVHVFHKHLSIRSARILICTLINLSWFNVNAACVVLISDRFILFENIICVYLTAVSVQWSVYGLHNPFIFSPFPSVFLMKSFITVLRATEILWDWENFKVRQIS